MCSVIPRTTASYSVNWLGKLWLACTANVMHATLMATYLQESLEAVYIKYNHTGMLFILCTHLFSGSAADSFQGKVAKASL